MKVWVDFSTAPDPLFFRPIVRRLEGRGNTTWITAREYGETVAISEQCGFSFRTVGRHGGRTVAGKGLQILQRSLDLARLARAERPDLALSFNSYAQAVAAFALRIPFVTIMDYEHQPANHLAFRLARRVLVPRDSDLDVFRRQGARADRLRVFDGLKEHVSLVDFEADPVFPDRLRELGIPPEAILVTLRPPALWSTYHRFENDLFDEVVAHLARQPNAKVLLLPRYPEQAEHYRALGLPSIIVPARALDGLNLVYRSDLVVGAGGSMNREAVVLGTPAYTVFKGVMAGVDRRMIASGAMVQVEGHDDLARIVVRKKPAGAGHGAAGHAAVEQVIAHILDAGRGSERTSRGASVAPYDSGSRP